MTDLLTYLQEKKTEGADSLSLTEFLEDNEGYIISTRPCKPHKTLTWKAVKSFWIHEFKRLMSKIQMTAICNHKEVDWHTLFSKVLEKQNAILIAAETRVFHAERHSRKNKEMMRKIAEADETSSRSTASSSGSTIASKRSVKTVSENGSSKRSKGSASIESNTNSTHDQLCKQGFERFSTNPHQLNLYKHKIVQCGTGIKKRQEIPVTLFEKAQDADEKMEAITLTPYESYIDSCISTLNIKDIFTNSHIPDGHELSIPLIQNALLPFISKVFRKANAYGIKDSEANYSHRCIWPCVEAVIDSLQNDDILFDDGEKGLVAMEKKAGGFARYNADGVAFLNEQRMEVLLLEISGKYGLVDRAREAYDHVKGTFGALSMLHRILRTYKWGNQSLIHRTHVYFLHARETKLYLWELTLKVGDDGFFSHYELKRIGKASVPASASESSELRELLRLLLLLQDCLSSVVTTLEDLKKSHFDYLSESNPSEKRDPIDIYIEMDHLAILNKKAQYNGISTLFPTSVGSASST